MNEMVEKVAWDINEMIANLAHPVGMGVRLPEKAALAIAVIAISAMREPTLEMVIAAEKAWDESGNVDFPPAELWRIMIDQALK